MRFFTQVFNHSYTNHAIKTQRKKPPNFLEGRCLFNYSAIPSLKFGRERLTADAMMRPFPCVAPASGATDF